jgi:hypothetical protein
MSLAPSPTRRRALRAAQWLTAVLGGLAALVPVTGAQAQAATPAVPARAPVAPAVHLITINTKNWTGNAGHGSRSPAWYVDGSGVVHLQGAAKQTNSITTTAPNIGTLPAAAAPAQIVYTIVPTFNGTYADLEIDPEGDIFVVDPGSPAVTDLSFVSLEGVSYRPSGTATTIPLNATNWTSSVGGIRPPAWYTDSSGVVHLQGAAAQFDNQGTAANLIGTLPAAAAPAQTVYTVVMTNNVYADLAILPNGQIVLIDPRPPATKSYSIVSLESITFRPAGQGAAIPLASDWSGNAMFNSRGPAWYKDSSGVIHLQGAVTQTSTSGTTPNVIGTLPAAAAPGHTVHEIVHTYLGTYADLVIFPTGKLVLSNPRSPMVKDYSFVSLESITYRR